MFRQSSAVAAKTRDIPILPYIKNHAQNEHQNSIFCHVLVILTGSCVFSHVIL